MNENVEDDGYDATAAFQNRREMYQRVQELQRLEHDVIKRIADDTKSRKKELLKILSDWLLKQTEPTPIHAKADMISGCEMQQWLILQGHNVALQQEQNRCEHEFNEANNKYKAATPLGLGKVSAWFAEGGEQSSIKALDNVVQSKKSAYQKASERVESSNQRRQEFGKRFLRGCLANIQELEKSDVFGERCRVLVGELTNTVRAEWSQYLRTTIETMNSLDSNMNHLRRIYRIDRSNNGK